MRMAGIPVTTRSLCTDTQWHVSMQRDTHQQQNIGMTLMIKLLPVTGSMMVGLLKALINHACDRKIATSRHGTVQVTRTRATAATATTVLMTAIHQEQR